MDPLKNWAIYKFFEGISESLTRSSQLIFNERIDVRSWPPGPQLETIRCTEYTRKFLTENLLRLAVPVATVV